VAAEEGRRPERAAAAPSRDEAGERGGRPVLFFSLVVVFLGLDVGAVPFPFLGLDAGVLPAPAPFFGSAAGAPPATSAWTSDLAASESSRHRRARDLAALGGHRPPGPTRSPLTPE